jgi:hypothetical protein
VRLALDPVEEGRVLRLDPLDGLVDPGGDPVLPVLLLGDGQSGHGVLLGEICGGRGR